METIERAPRPEKVAVVDDVETRLNESAAALLTEYRGISVADLEKLRRALRAAGGEYKIYKNTLVRRAAKSAGVDELESLLTGPTAIAFVSTDVSAVAKVLRDFSREHPDLIVKGGVVGKDLISASDAAALAELPSREVLLAQIAGIIAAPMQRFASLLQAVPQKFAYAISALIESRPAEAAPAAPAAEPAATTDAEPQASSESAGESDASTSDDATESATADTGVVGADAASAESETAESAAAESDNTENDAGA